MTKFRPLCLNPSDLAALELWPEECPCYQHVRSYFAIVPFGFSALRHQTGHFSGADALRCLDAFSNLNSINRWSLNKSSSSLHAAMRSLQCFNRAEFGYEECKKPHRSKRCQQIDVYLLTAVKGCLMRLHFHTQASSLQLCDCVQWTWGASERQSCAATSKDRALAEKHIYYAVHKRNGSDWCTIWTEAAVPITANVQAMAASWL